MKEKALTRARDALAAERRRMPWMAVEKAYVFEGPDGKASLLDLFEGRRQLIVYRAFFEPGVFGWPDHACRGCSLVADQVGHLAHLNARDTTLVYASRAPQADIARLKARMGWEMPWYTITDSFDADFGVDEWHGHNVFIRDGERVFRTYFINNRGDEAMGTVWSYLDLNAARPPGGLGGFAGGLSADAALQMVELARQLRGRSRARPEMGRGVRCRRGGVPEPRYFRHDMSETAIAEGARSPSWSARLNSLHGSLVLGTQPVQTSAFEPSIRSSGRLRNARSVAADRSFGWKRSWRLNTKKTSNISGRRPEYYEKVVPGNRGASASTVALEPSRSSLASNSVTGPENRGFFREVVAKNLRHAQQCRREPLGNGPGFVTDGAQPTGKRIADVDRAAASSPPRHVAHPGGDAEREAGIGAPAASRSRIVPSRRCGSFCEPSIAICQVRCRSAGLAKRSSSARL